MRTNPRLKIDQDHRAVIWFWGFITVARNNTAGKMLQTWNKMSLQYVTVTMYLPPPGIGSSWVSHRSPVYLAEHLNKQVKNKHSSQVVKTALIGVIW